MHLFFPSKKVWIFAKLLVPLHSQQNTTILHINHVHFMGCCFLCRIETYWDYMNFLHTFFLYVFYVRLTPYICTYNLDILSLLEFSTYSFLICFLRTFSLVCFSHRIQSTCIFYIQFLGMFSTYVQPSMFFT